ncbi:tRNA(Ser) Um(44) 2'-O-methyltransferase [Coemansia sp. RSA 552]|nr:tRNA(Ser) Um(44) 2'-O-methyltransferase [Coemansia sp. RSA 552]
MSSRLAPERPALGAEEVDMEAEALRLAEYAKYKPVYYWDEVRELQAAGSSWRLLAAADIEGSEEAHFLGVMDEWALAAEVVIPPVERTIVLDPPYTPEPSPAQGSTPVLRHVRRMLIAKRKDKDQPLAEDVIVSRLDAGIIAQFVPRVDDPATIPFYYPQASAYAFGYLDSVDGAGHDTSRLVILARELTAGSTMATKKQRMVWQDLLKKLYKWTVTRRFGYQKREVHDIVVNYEAYAAKYRELKAKYALRWVEGWPEQTDPRKFVYEDIAIASWLICLWSQECGSSKRPTFADLGCGNGFLVYLLNSEGYDGYGIDQSARKIWQQYGRPVDLRAQTLEPYDFAADTDWIIGNHADELAPWIPIIAAQHSNCSFVVIPCCPHHLSGRKMAPSTAPGQSKYHAYVQYISGIIEQCGYEAEKEFLRIPSTKNVKQT